MKLFRHLLETIRKIVGWTTVILLGWMVTISFVQLLFRWFSISGLEWADQQARYLVLWLALLGGVLAAAGGRHIKIDLISNLASEGVGETIQRIMSGLAAIVAAYLTLISIRFLVSEKKAAVSIDGLLFGMTISTWVAELVIPIGFALMSLYFLGIAILPDEPDPSQGAT